MLPRVLLVAKPWRGGLGRYVFEALDELLEGRVQWIRTYPEDARSRLRYARDRGGWRRDLARRINDAPCDLRLFINGPPFIDLVDRRRPNILWATDDPMLYLRQGDPFDAVYLSDPGYIARVREEVGEAYAGVLPFACWPAVHRPLARVGEGGACFVANRDRRRDFYLEELLRRGAPLTVYGNYFARHRLHLRHPLAFRPSVSNDALGRVYARHSCSLNIHADVIRAGTNMRTFECAAFGIPQLVEWREGLDAYFAPDEEIMLFRSAEEADDKLRRLMADRDLAARMARRAQVRALAEHTYGRRLTEVLRHA